MRRGAAAALLLALHALALPGRAVDDADWPGPAPRDAKGRFENLGGPWERAGPTVTLPFFARRILGGFRSHRGLPARVPDAAGALARARTGGTPTVTWVGHSTLLFHHDGTTWLSDPQWSGHAGPGGIVGARRLTEPGLPLEALPALDFVVVSHDHYDHLDVPTLRALAARQPELAFYVPIGNGELLRDEGIQHVVELDWGESRRHGGVRIRCLPARHWSRRGLLDMDRALWSSWAVIGDERRVWFAGDTGLFPELAEIGRRFGPFDLAALPIGAYEPVAMMGPVHLDPEEAVEAAGMLRAGRALGMHYGTFDLTDEPVAEPPARFRAAARAVRWAPGRAWLLSLGETGAF